MNENEVTAQAVFFVEDSQRGTVRPMAPSDSIPRVNAVEIVSQVDQDHRLALQLSRERPSRNDREGSSARYEVVARDPEMGRIERDLLQWSANPRNRAVEGRDADWTLARSLQVMEFEMANDPANREPEYESIEDRDFLEKEYRASSFCRQLNTTSTFVCLAQIIVFIATICIDGFASTSENPMMGPPLIVLVRFGAKQAGIMLYHKQWWRSLSAIFLHAGILHLLPNVLIQLRVGGYLNIIFGTPQWLWIYFSSGVFGYLCSCIFEPNTVGVGSSGALLGMLMAWVVWIIFRWRKIPVRFHKQRNCQLTVVVVSIVITLGMSFAKYVDWAAHFGGAFFVSIVFEHIYIQFDVYLLQLGFPLGTGDIE